MKFEQMLAWTKRLNEVRSMKNGSLRAQRMRNLRNDFFEACGWGDGISNSNDPFVHALYGTIEQDYFLFV